MNNAAPNAAQAACAVFFGGAAGSVLRALLTATQATAPLIVVNVVGAFLLGLALIFIRRPASLLKPFIITGLLGGFTSFSALAATGALPMLLNLVLGWCAAVAGLWLGRRMVP